jgi:hypothetical protein
MAKGIIVKETVIKGLLLKRLIIVKGELSVVNFIINGYNKEKTRFKIKLLKIA